LAGVLVDSLTEAEVVQHVRACLAGGRGGWIVTPNVDILRIAAHDPLASALVSRADLAVPDGAPLLWAARVGRAPLPERVTGANLLQSLAEAAAVDGRSVYVLGGAAGVPDQAAAALQERYPGLRVAGTLSPAFGFDRTAEGVEEVRAAVVAAAPDIVFVGLGFPRQERLIEVLRRDLPAAWLLGCGAAIPFAAGTLGRAPGWMQRHGLEWVHRLVHEPRRLGRRYLAQDLPFALTLLGDAVRGQVEDVTTVDVRGSAQPGVHVVGEDADAGDLVVGEPLAEGAESLVAVHGPERGTGDAAAQAPAVGAFGPALVGAAADDAVLDLRTPREAEVLVDLTEGRDRVLDE
jgi:N-acetylglucosaminyldiphosphoundecaprenol N-acetyl-beta-D-mannosaminyltransferase